MAITFNIEDSYTYQLGKEEGKTEGREEGKVEGKIEGIIAMLKLDIDPDQIVEHLEVTIELVQKIQRDLDLV